MVLPRIKSLPRPAKANNQVPKHVQTRSLSLQSPFDFVPPEMKEGLYLARNLGVLSHKRRVSVYLCHKDGSRYLGLYTAFHSGRVRGTKWFESYNPCLPVM